MAHKEHQEFTDSVFRKLCDDAQATIPQLDVNDTWENKAEIVLAHLKEKTIEFCGVEVGLGLDNVKGFPRYGQLLSEIVDIVDFDMIHHHGPFHFFRKAPIVMKYVIDLIGEKAKTDQR